MSRKYLSFFTVLGLFFCLIACATGPNGSPGLYDPSDPEITESDIEMDGVTAGLSNDDDVLNWDAVASEAAQPLNAQTATALDVPGSAEAGAAAIDSAVRELQTAVDEKPEEVPTITVNAAKGITQTILGGQATNLYEMLKAMMERLHRPDWEDKSFTLSISPMPVPNAMIDIQKREMVIYTGLLAVVDSEDELAFVLAHEMTHGNFSILRSLEADPQIRGVVSQIPDSLLKGPGHQEEIRADIGAVKRMIAAGYNPWAAFNLIEKFAKTNAVQRRRSGFRFLSNLLATNFGYAQTYFQSHPDPIVRMQAIKAYIIGVSQTQQDLHGQVQTYRAFSQPLRTLRFKAKVMAYPFTNRIFLGAIDFLFYYNLFKGFGKFIPFPKELLFLKPAIDNLTHLVNALSYAVGKLPIVVGAGFGIYFIGKNPEKVIPFLKQIPGSVVKFFKSTGSKAAAVYDGIKDIFAKRSRLERALQNYANLDATLRTSVYARAGREIILELWGRRASEVILSKTVALREDFFRVQNSRWLTSVRRALLLGLGADIRALGANSDAKNGFREMIGEKLIPLVLDDESLILSLLNGTPTERQDFVTIAKFLSPDAPLLDYFAEAAPLAAEKRQETLKKILKLDFTKIKSSSSIYYFLHSLSKPFSDFGVPKSKDQIDLEENYRSDDIDPAMALSAAAVLVKTGAKLPGITLLLRDLHTGVAFMAFMANEWEFLAPFEKAQLLQKSLDHGDPVLYRTLLEKSFEELVTFAFQPTRSEQQSFVFETLVRILNTAIAIERRKIYGVRSSHWEKLLSRLLERQPGAWSLTSDVDATNRANSLAPRSRIQRSQQSDFVDQLRSVQNFKMLVEGVLPAVNGSWRDSDSLVSATLLETLSHPQWFTTAQDLNAFLEEMPFPRVGVDLKGLSEMDKIFKREMIRQSSGRVMDRAWLTDYDFSRKVQLFYLERYAAIMGHPVSAEPLQRRLEIWLQLAKKAVTDVTDDLYKTLVLEYEGRSVSERAEFAKLTMDLNLIWGRAVQENIFRWYLGGSTRYRDILAHAPGPTRVVALREFLQEIEKDNAARSANYIFFLEDLALRLGVTREESRIIADRKAPSIGNHMQDLGARIMSVLVDQVLGWTRSEQWELITYLRDQGPITKKLRKEFYLMGPERLKRLFQELPALGRAAIIDSILSAPEGILPRFERRSRSAQMVLNHLLDSAAASESRSICKEIIQSFLSSFEKTGNRPLQSSVLSYLLSHSTEGGAQGNMGYMLKEFLDAYGTMGRKLAQFIAAAELLPPEETRILSETQDNAARPTIESIYKELEELGLEELHGIRIIDILGAASLKYAILVKKPNGTMTVLKILRKEAIIHTPMEFAQLQVMADELAAANPRRYTVLKRVVRAARRAVEAELSFAQEVERGEVARNVLFPDETVELGGGVRLHVHVPHERRLHDRVIEAEFAPGTSYGRLAPEVQAQVAPWVLARGAAHLMAATKDGRVIADPDRHPGNFRFHLRTPHDIDAAPIDWGQLMIMKATEHEFLVNLFALSQIFAHTGPTHWLVENLLQILPGSSPAPAEMGARLAQVFPLDEPKSLAAFYNLLAVLEDAGVELPVGSYDWARGFVAHVPYTAQVSAEAETPARTLEQAVREHIAVWEPQLRANLSLGEKVRIGLRDLQSWWRSPTKKSDSCEESL